MRPEISDILKLSTAEKIIMVETIWDNIASENSKLKLSKEEKELLDERLASYKKNPENVRSWEDFKKELKRKKK